jgi:4-hydroxy-tetrahydrodipicolinate synthase
VNVEKLGELLDHQIAEGIDAVVILGTTGESSTTPTDEHIDIVAKAVEFVGGRIPIIAGTGSNSTAEAIHLSQKAEEVGADALLSVTPYYNKTSQKGLVAHFSAIAKKTTLPIILYNVPGRTGMNITPEACAEMSRIENIVGVKECNTDQMGMIRALCEPDFTLYTGEDGLVIPMLGWGGVGVISVWSNICPKDVHTLVTSWLEGDYDKAREIQIKGLPLIKALFSEVNPIPVKEALNILGWEVGEPRLPLIRAEEGTRDMLATALKEYGVQPRR